MAINEAVNIDIDVNGTSTVKQAANAYEDLGDAVSQTQLEAEKLAQQFGINDKRTQEAIKVAGRYKQQLEELDFAIDGARGGADQLFRAAQGVTAGFELAAGATALFGTESEELEKVLLRVQGALVFSQGLRDLKEFAPAILNVARATRAWYVSLSLVQKAFLSLGIGLIIEGILRLSDAFSSVSEETKKAAEEQKAYNDQIRDLQNERIALTQGELRASQIRLFQKEQELKANEREIELLKERIKQDKEVLSLTGQKSLDADENLKNLQKATLANFKLTNEVIRLRQQTDKLFFAQLEQQEQTNKSTKSVDDNTEAIRKNNEEMQKLIDKQNELKGQTIETITETGEATMRTTEATLEFVEGRQKSALDRAKLFIGAYGQDIVNTFQETLSVVGALSNAFAGADEERQKKAFELNKRLAVVQTTISTIEATVNAYKEAQKNPLNQATAGAYAVTQALLAAAFGLAQVQQIRSQEFTGVSAFSVQGGQGGGGFAQGLQAAAVRLPRTEQFTGQQRIYVTEYDISNTQEKVKVTEDVSIVK
jgi:hypothetical protein